MIQQLPPERGFRGPGCDERCVVVKALVPGVFGRSELLLHDPDAHQEFGRVLGAAGGRAALGTATVLTGGLTVDLATLEVACRGHPVRLTALEMRLLVTLTRQLGMTVVYAEIGRALWGAAFDAAPPVTSHHMLRVNLARIRAKLGRDAGLLVTVVGTGLRLDAVPPGDPPRAEHWPNGPHAAERWSSFWAECLHCGETRFPHAGRGYCSACHSRAWRRPKPRHLKTTRRGPTESGEAPSFVNGRIPS